MTFLAPWAAWFLAGLPILVLLYLLKLQRRPLTVSTLMFWQRVLQESRRRALFQRLRNLLSLLLHLLIFLLIVAALARPAFDRFVRNGSSTVLIIDTRARMQALEPDGESRFEKARGHAIAAIRETSGTRQIALLAAHASPQVLVPFTADEQPLREALAALQPTDAAGDLESAITLAEDLLASRKGDRRIVVITDSALAKTATEHSTPNTHFSVASPRDNLAITRFATRPLLTSPDTSEVLLELRNFGRAVARGNVELAFDGKRLDVKPFEIEPGGRKLEVFPSVPRASRTSRGWLTARLDTADALAADNVAYAALPAPRPHRVLLVTRGNWFLEKLLAADQQVTFELLAPDAFQLPMAAQFDAVIFDNQVPPGFDLAQAAGNFLFIKASPFSEPKAVPLEQPLITDTDAAHPLLRLVNLQNVTIVRAAPLPLPAPAAGWTFTAPLRSFDHPLLLSGTRRTATTEPAARPSATPVSPDEQRLAVLAFDIAESDLPLRVAFPLLMANAVHWLAGEAPAAPLALRAGELLPLAENQTLWTEPQTHLNAPPKAPAAELARTFHQPLRNGFYLREQPGASEWIAVNTFSETESDLRQEGAPSAPVASSRAAALVNVSGWPLWRWLALAAFALFAAEWWLFHRRRTE